MTSKERVIKALKREEPDRLPTFEWVIHPRIIKALTDQDSEIEFIRQMDIDGIAVSPNMKKKKIDNRHFRDEWGIVRVSNDEYPMPVGFPIQTEDDMKRLNVPDPDADYRFENLNEALKVMGDEKAIIARLRDVFSQPRDLMGYENFLISFYMQPALATRLMEISVDYNTRLAKNARAIGVEIIVVGDDIADNRSTLISPEIYRSMVLPHFQRLIRNFKDMGLYVIKHTDGNITDLLDDIVSTGIDCLDPIDPMAGLDIGKIKKDYGSRVCLKGNIDCVHTLTEKSEAGVIAEVKDCIMKASPGGGHIISSSNTIHSGINPFNYKVFLQAIKDYGRYPLDIDKLKS